MISKIGKIVNSFRFRSDFSDYHGAICVYLIKDNANDLVGKELDYLSNGGKNAMQAFTTGRSCVRAIQRNQKLDEVAVLPGAYGPLWQQGTVGSISHSKKLAAAILLHEKQGVGIDIENKGRLTSKVIRRVATEKERETLAKIPSFDWTLVFSAKESIFKAINPLVRSYFGFRDVELGLNMPNQSFSVKYVGSKLDGKLLDRCKGFWADSGDHLITFVIVE